MRILHICPLWFRVAVDAPGGIETLMPGLFAELGRAGADNTILGVAGAQVSGRLIPMVEEPLYEQTTNGTAWEYGPFEQHELLTVLELADDFDVIHSHLGWSGWVLSGMPGLGERTLHTQHNPVSPDMEWFVRRHPDIRLTTVSQYQAHKLWRLGARRCHVVHNGIDFSLFPLRDSGKQGLVYLGRLEHDKGADLAIEVARTLGMTLTLAGPAVNHEFFETQITPHLDDQIRYAGIVGHEEKTRLLGGASCVLMPSREEEGFGLVALEAMACGTAVVGLANGALPEIIEEGVTGFVTPDERGLAELVPAAERLDPSIVRRTAEQRFSVAASAAGYLGLYQLMTDTREPRT
jgi:glycosyltransferase involved in cell wall biosynthesis